MNLRKITNKTLRRLLLTFEILSLILLFVYQKGSVNKEILITGLGLIFVVYISNILLYKISSGDCYIFLIATMLISIGILMIYRLNPALGSKQIIWAALGIVSFYLTYFILKNIKTWHKGIYLYTGLAYLLFAITLIFAPRKEGAKNWISIFGVSFQPAEIIKLLLIFILAAFYSHYKYNTKTGKNKYSSYALMGIVYSFVALLFLQTDLGMALIFYGVFIVIQFIFEKDRKIIFINLALFIFSAILGYFLFSHVRIRVETWINPWVSINDKGYQITQSLFAIAEGGFFGKGLGLGHPEFIPLPYNDFIFSAIIEEMGIFTGIGIIMLFLILFYRGFKIAISQSNTFYRILALGMSVLFCIQSFIIIGGVIKLIPLTGITLPFVSYGGSSLVASFISLGVLQAASEDIESKVKIDE